uniref:C2 domain-containing protein n=2 Tax=Pseudo-nitzschia australis TaxID=44445 RepID=A0A7S4AHC1_9STRA
MFSFLPGFLSGVGSILLYQNYYASEDDDTHKDTKRESLLTPEDRATQSGKNVTHVYNEAADYTTASHINFLSDIVARLWPYIDEAATPMVRDIAAPAFKDLPFPLSTLKFRKFDLGHVPFVLDNILVRELREMDDHGVVDGKKQEYMQFEWDITWHSKCDIQLATDKVGGVIAIAFGVKGFSLSGRLQVIAKPLSGVLPCMDAIQFAFVNPPKIELDFTGLANVADVQMYGLDIKKFVRQVVDDALAQSMVLPNRTIVPLVDKVDYRDIFCPPYKGLARVRLHSGRGFQVQQATKPFGKEDIPDVYVKIRLGAEKFFESSVVNDSCTPKWDPNEEFHDFLNSGGSQVLEIQVWDRDTGVLDADDELGIAHLSIGQILLGLDGNGKFEVQLMKRATKPGKNDTPTTQYITISFEKLSFTTKDLSSMLQIGGAQTGAGNANAKVNKKPKSDRVVGLTTVLISHATNLPFAKEENANTFVKLWSGTGPNRVEIGVTPTICNSLNPGYQTPFSIPTKASDAINGLYKVNGLPNYTMEMFQQGPSDLKPKSLGEIVIEHKDVKNKDRKEWLLRDSRPIGDKDSFSKYRTELAFSISFAGVSRPSLKGKENISTTEGKNGTSNDDSESKIVANETNSTQNSSGRKSEIGSKIRVRIVKGHGFQTGKKIAFRKADIPDVYCTIKFGASPATWRTATIKDQETPHWENETHDYIMESPNEVISIDVWDQNRKGDDDFYGNARASVGKILTNGGSLEVELKTGEQKMASAKAKALKMLRGSATEVQPARMFITVECYKL